MLNKYRVLAGAVAIALALTSGGRLAAQIQPDDEGNQLWFVELQTSAATFRARAASSSIVYTERFAFNRLWNGLSVVASEAEAGRIGRVAGVRAVFPVLTFGIDPPDDTLEPEMKYALAMTGASDAQAGPDGATGAGIKVAVIDTGVDYHHPDLGGGFGAGYHVAYGYDFVGDRYDAGTGGGLYQVPHPDADPDDCNGHGTHVAGIIGATGDSAGGVLGVAPGVTLGAYRVFGCDGSTSADIMLAAMERAYSDGMQVVNMSIGAAFQNWPQHPTAVAADALVAKGVVVVAAIGNSGANGVYSAGAPGVGRNVIGVASYDNTFADMPYFETNDGTKFGYTPANGGAAIPTTGSAPIVRTGTPASAADACNTGTPPAPPALGDLTGKIALIRRGTCSFYEKSINAQNTGAIGVVLYNNAFGPFLTPTVQPPVEGAPTVQIPVVMLTDSTGVALNNKIAAGSVTLTWTNKLDVFPQPTGGRASGFSAYGLDAELQLKPNIGAPGGFIRSTFPLEVQPYAVLNGTSMSSPHVAGAVALYLEKHPNATPAQVKTALQNSADPVNFFSGPTEFGIIDSVHKQGAGMLDIDDAILATTSITPSEISVGEGTAAKSFLLTITNGSESPVTYSITHQGAVATAGTFQVSFFNNPATFSTPTPSITLPPGGSQVVSVTITPPTGGDLHVYGGYIRITGDRTYRVPYAGLRGNYQAIQVLARGGCVAVPFPAIFRQGGETICRAATPTAAAIKLDVAYTPQATGATFNVEELSDRPLIFYHLAHQSRRLEIRAIHQLT